MTRLATFVARRPAATYFALTFAISWGGALFAIGGSGGMRGTTPSSDPRFVHALLAMLAGPSISGILLTWLVSGSRGVRELISRLLTWRVPATDYAMAILTAPSLMAATLLLLSSVSSAFIPGIVTSSDKMPLLLVSLGVGLAAGIIEELGWTGFAIPVLRRRYDALTAGLIVGVLWSAWHLFPLVWSSRAAAGELAMPVYLFATVAGIFVGYLTAFRVLMVWVYDRTESLLIGMLMHVSLTASLLTLNPLNITGTNLVAYSFALAAAVWIVAAAMAVRTRGRAEHQPIESTRRAA